MSHLEQRLQEDLDRISSHVDELNRRVDTGLHDAFKALLRRDHALAAKTILGDHPINRGTRRVDNLCHMFVVRHIPAAGNLRYVSAVLRLMVALERVGDYAVTIARETVQLESTLPESIAEDIEALGDYARALFRDAMSAFKEVNAERAKATKSAASSNKQLFQKVFRFLVRAGQQEDVPFKDVLALLLVLNRIERVVDQAKNICEEAIFAATGEIKPPKVYKVLFADRTNAVRSQIAMSIARKEFPESGSYSSAGLNPSAAPDEAVRNFLAARGYDVDELAPRLLRTSVDELNDHHVVVCLDRGVFDSIDEIPFHTVVLEWDVGPNGDDAASLSGDELLTRLHDDLAGRVRELMTTLRGDDAS